MDNRVHKGDRLFFRCTAVTLAAIVLINLLSSSIRHLEAGLGCEPWPECYAVVGARVAAVETEPTPIAVQALTPAEAAKQAHRAIATALVVLVLIVTYLARRRLPTSGPAAFLPHALIGVVLLLSVIGPASYLKTVPAIASVNLLGGMALLALTSWLWIATRPATAGGPTVPGRPVRVAFAALLVQLALGAWASANFAGIACSGVWTCTESAPAGFATSFWYLRELQLDEGGRVIMNQAQVYIHAAHRIGAAVTAAAIGWLGVALLRAGRTSARWGYLLLGLLALQLALGIAGSQFGLPLAVVVLHGFIASMLLVALLRLLLAAGTPRARSVRS